MFHYYKNVFEIPQFEFLIEFQMNFVRSIGKMLRRATRNWNVENRAQRQLLKDSEKLRPAPKPKAMESLMDEARASLLSNPEKEENTALVNRMAQMEIKSKPEAPPEVTFNSIQ